jgi:hypothetical protein
VEAKADRGHAVSKQISQNRRRGPPSAQTRPLCSMTGDASPQPRCLFVVSRKHEQLSLALSFLRDQHFAERSLMLLPDSLHAVHGDALPVPTRAYAGGDDVRRAVDEHEPDLVFLFSGYLLSLNRLVSVQSLHTLLDHLHARGARAVTSDPFWGLLPRLKRGQIDVRWLAPDRPAWVRWPIQLVVRLHGRIEPPRLERLIHLYPTPAPHIDDGVTRLAFFNPSAPAVARGATLPGSRDVKGERPRWLFTLSTLDLQGQLMQLGRREFIEVLLGMLRYAIEMEAEPTLLAPRPVVSLLHGVLPPPVEVMPPCPYPEYQRRLLEAQYVFSWNPMSASLLPRLINGFPTFFFDRGYYSKVIKPYHATGRDCHLSGWDPSLLDQRQIFSPYVLAHLAKGQQAPLSRLRDRCQALPAPAAVVEQALANDRKPASP